MDFSKFESAIKSTGFPLEFSISETLRKEGWSVINGRYYIDDQSGTVREIDIIAYRASKVQDFLVSTTIVISCKKSEKNLWALLSKNIDKRDVNTDWKPVHTWTNHKVLEFIRSEEGFKDRYYTYITDKKVGQALRVPDTHIFAFQEMNIGSGAVQNDKAIFGSVTGLMKAQAYELASLPKRHISKRVYQFNLVSIVQSDLIKLHFEGDSIKGSQIDQDHYVGRYIINGKETFARVHFIQESAFAKVIKDYNQLHNANCSFFNDEYDRFFLDAAKNYEKSKLFEDELSRELKLILLKKYRASLRLIKGSVCLDWLETEKLLYIALGFDLEETLIERFNNDRELIDSVGELLKKLYRYEGEFKFVQGWTPF